MFQIVLQWKGLWVFWLHGCSFKNVAYCFFTVQVNCYLYCFFLRKSLSFIARLHEEMITLWPYICLSSQANVTSYKSISIIILENWLVHKYHKEMEKWRLLTLYNFSNIDKNFCVSSINLLLKKFKGIGCTRRSIYLCTIIKCMFYYICIVNVLRHWSQQK